MIGKKDTVAIFESYQTYLKEQNDNGLKDLNTVKNAVSWFLGKIPESEIAPILSFDDRTKFYNFLLKPEIRKAYAAYNLRPGAYLDDRDALGFKRPAEGDASTVNMGKGGVLEVQPDGEYPKGE